MTSLRGNSYQAVQAAIMKRIGEREWPPGTLIPNEVQLAAEFGCARATMNRALRELAATGILERKRRAGTRVALNPVRKATLDIPITRHEVESRGAVHGYELIACDRVKASGHVAARLGLSVGTAMLHVRCRHLADGRPFQYEDRWIHIAAAPGILDAPLDALSANEWLVQEIPYSRGEIVFSAAVAGEPEAAMLEIDCGAAVFVIERTTWLADAPVTLARMHYPPEYRMVTSL